MTKAATAETVSQFTIKQDILQAALSAIAGVIESKTTIPVLSHLLIESPSDGLLRLTGTDLDLTITRDVAAETTKGLALCLPSRKLLDIVKALPSGEDVKFDVEENGWARLKCGKSNYRIAGVSRDSFPEIQTPAGRKLPFTIPGETLRRLIRHTIFSITTERSRFTLSGAKVEIADGKIRMITTDGHRLSFAETAIDSDEKLDVLVPRKALAELAKINVEELTFGADSRHIYFAAGDESLVSRMLTGQFPDYKMVLPKDNDKLLKLPSEAFRSALRRVSLMADERNCSMRLEIAPGEITLKAQASEVGECEEAVAIDFAGEPITLGYNWHYLRDLLAVADSEKAVMLSYKDAVSQTEFGIEDDAGFRHIIMPLRI